MRLFFWTILRSKNLQQIHKRSRHLSAMERAYIDEVKSLRRMIDQKKQKIENLEKKCSLVNVSAMKNRIEELEKQWIESENERIDLEGFADEV